MSSEKFKMEGMKELEVALMELPKATAKNVLLRIAKKAGEPIQASARAKAPRRTGRLSKKINVGPKARLTRSQKRGYQPESDFEYFIGAYGSPRAHLQEFGTRHHKAQPFLRPAWEETRLQALGIIKTGLKDEIEAARKRLARKAERLEARIRSGAK